MDNDGFVGIEMEDFKSDAFVPESLKEDIREDTTEAETSMTSEPEGENEKKILTEEDIEVFKVVVNGDITELRSLKEKLGNLPVKNEEGNPLIHYAVKAGRINIIAFLLEQEMDVNITNPNGTSPLHLAAFSGHNEIMEMLLYNKANINHQDISGNSALHFSCQFNQMITSMMLVNFGAKMDLINSIGDIPLHGACRNNMIQVVMRMCELGCPNNNANGHGETPLHLAAKAGSSEAVRTLLLHGAQLEKVDKNGTTAEGLATDPDVIKLFTLYNQVMQSSSQNKKFEMRKQLAVSDKPISRLKIAVLGNSGVGKTVFIESLKCGFLKSFLWSSYYTISKAAKIPKESVNNALNYTKGVTIQSTNLSDVGDVTIYDYSGLELYRDQFSLFLGDSSTIHLIVTSANDSIETRFKQIDFWLEFLRIRMIPKDPIGFAGCSLWAPNVFLVMTNADENNSIKNMKGEWILKNEENFLGPLILKYERDIILNKPVFVLDAQLPNSLEMKELKRILLKLKNYIQNFLPTQMGCLEQTYLELPNLRNSLTSFPIVGFGEFCDFVRERVNVLASDDIIKELLDQLQLMGEVICYGMNPDEVIVLSPTWLGSEVIGKLFSPDTFKECNSLTGFVSESFLRSAFQKFDFVKIMNLLKALNICHERTIKVDTKEYYFHAFNKINFYSVCTDWQEARNSTTLRSAVCLASMGPVKDQLVHAFAHIISALHIVFLDKNCEFGQWKNACRVYEDGKTAIIIFDDEKGNVTIMCNSNDDNAPKLFSFSETICAVVYNSIDQQCPGLFLQRKPASWADCQNAIHPPYFYEPYLILCKQLESLYSDIQPGEGKQSERLVDVLSFGYEEGFKKMIISTEAHVCCLSYYAKSQLAWCFDRNLDICKQLAQHLKIDEQVVPIEPGSVSIFDRMLQYWSTDESLTIRKLSEALKACGGEEILEVLLKLTPIFVYLPTVSVLEEN